MEGRPLLCSECVVARGRPRGRVSGQLFRRVLQGLIQRARGGGVLALAGRRRFFVWTGCGGVRAGREAPGARGPIAGPRPRGGAALEPVRKILTDAPKSRCWIITRAQHRHGIDLTFRG